VSDPKTPEETPRPEDLENGETGNDDPSLYGLEEEDGDVDAIEDELAEADDEPAAEADAGGSGGGDEPPSDDDGGAPGDSGDSGDSGGHGDEDAEDEDDEDGAPDEMTLVEHLEELRNRIVRCAIAVIVGFACCYGFAKELFGILMEPMVQVLNESNFIYTYPPEAFFAYLKTALVAGFMAVSPYIFYQVWMFVTPGLYSHERKWLVPIAFFSALLFSGGALFGYFVVFPYGFEFFASFTDENIAFTPKLSEYFGFALKLLFAFGFVFELPLIIFFLARLGLVDHKDLRGFQKYTVILAFVVSALLTPPDVFTQLLMAGPLILLYEVGIWVAYVFSRKKARQEAMAGEDEEGDENESEPEPESEPESEPETESEAEPGPEPEDGDEAPAKKEDA
jgi:sec-independent protein translocase protein TatC